MPRVGRKEQRMEDREVLGCTGELVNEEHERLLQYEMNPDRGREDRRGLPAVTLRPGLLSLGVKLV